MAGWWPDADAAAGHGEAAPTQDELLDEGIAAEITNELPSLDAGRRSLAIPKAIAGVCVVVERGVDIYQCQGCYIKNHNAGLKPTFSQWKTIAGNT
eukprot:11991455-Karenia_brevis.AAC.1